MHFPSHKYIFIAFGSLLLSSMALADGMFYPSRPHYIDGTPEEVMEIIDEPVQRAVIVTDEKKTNPVPSGGFFFHGGCISYQIRVDCSRAQ